MEESHLSLELESPGPITRTIKGEIAWEPVRDKLEEAYKELGKTITIKGFRKGRVPKGMLKKMFQKRIAAEISHNLVQEALVDAIGRLELRPVESIPQWEVDEQDIVEGEPLTFSATLEVLPEPEVEHYEGLEVSRREVNISDEDVEHELERQRQDMTQYLPVEGTEIAPGHIMNTDLMGKVGEETISDDRFVFKVLGPDEDPPESMDPKMAALVTRISAELVGTSPEDTSRELEIQWGEEAPEGWASQEARLLLEIKGVVEEQAPGLDDDFARDMGEADTLAEYRQIVRKRLEEAEEKRIKRELHDALAEALIEKNPIEVSSTLVERQLNSVMERTRLALQVRGLPADMLPFDSSEMRDKLRDSAEKEVKKTLLTDALGKKLKIEVTDEEITERLEEIARARVESLERIRAEYEKNSGIETLRVVMVEQKVLDLLLERAHVTKMEESEPTETEDPDNAKKSDDEDANQGAEG